MRIIIEIRLTEGWLTQNPAGSCRTHEPDEKLSHEFSSSACLIVIAQLQTLSRAGRMYTYADATPG